MHWHNVGADLGTRYRTILTRNRKPVSVGAVARPTLVVDHLVKDFAPRRRWWRRGVEYGAVRALDDCSLAVEPGSVCALFGLNGAGKTTLLKILATLLEPTTGRAAVCGHDVVRDADRVRRCIGWMTGESRTFYWRLSGADNLHFFAALHGLTRAEAARRIAEISGPLDLGGLLSRTVATYSSGQQQRLSIARALLGRPQVLLCDEPTQSLDIPTAQFLRRFLREELSRRRGCTVLFTSHQIDDVRDTADRVIVLEQGRVAADTDAEAFLATHTAGSLTALGAP